MKLNALLILPAAFYSLKWGYWKIPHHTCGYCSASLGSSGLEAALPTPALWWFRDPSVFLLSPDLYRHLNGAATWGRLFWTHLKTLLSHPSSLLVIPLLWGSLVLWIKTKLAFVFRSSRNKSLVTQIAENNERLMNTQNPHCRCVKAPCRGL